MSYPEILPVLPLTKSLLLPGTLVMVNAVRPGHRRLIEDVLEADGLVGLLQPIEDEPADGFTAELYGIGCLGHIERCQETADGYSTLLKGVVRFERVEELVVVEDEIPDVVDRPDRLRPADPRVAVVEHPAGHVRERHGFGSRRRAF